jgi:hypothetical protein
VSLCNLIYKRAKAYPLHSTGNMEKPCFVFHIK